MTADSVSAGNDRKMAATQGPAMGKAVNMAFERGVLTIDNCTPEDYESIWRPYLDMDRDYGAIKAELSEADPTIKGACDYGYGIRILRQDFWESVVSFIISQNNNIPRIKGCIEALCAAFGERIGEYGGKEYFSIPSPGKTGLFDRRRPGTYKAGIQGSIPGESRCPVH